MNNILKERLASNKVCIGGWITAPIPVVAEAMAKLGFHWVAVDMEHAPISEGDLQGVFIALEKYDVAPMVRLPFADPSLGRRVLDAGAAGLIVPAVEDAIEFGEFAAHCFYPPKGTRGVGLSRCNGWGETFEDYLENFQPVLIPQIETVHGVAAAREILELDEVDAIFVGPYDLSANLGERGDFSAAEFKKSMEAIRHACTSAMKPAGIHQVDPDPNALRNQVEAGFRFVAYGTDMIAMRSALELPKNIQ